MNKFKTGILFVLGLCTLESTAQNLLNLSDWVTGSGGTAGFTMNGLVTENEREWGIGPQGRQVIVWKGTPNGDAQADGGFASVDIPINHQKTYRFSIWIKRTNSKSGTAYFGCGTVNTLAGAVNNNPYFWSGNLPELDKWYLLVGYVHGSNDPSTVSSGGIYDGVTGKRVLAMVDYKFMPTTTSTRLRSYLYYDSNTSDRQYFYGPRLEEVNGNELTISSLLDNPIGLGDFSFSGKVGIKTTTPGAYDLAVNGKIRSQEIKVETSGWPDYVFKEDYKLPSLTETEKFIKENGHLPEVPKAADAEVNGISLGEMNKILLKKIEELTLYLIDLEKSRTEQQQLIEQQVEALNQVTKQLNEIKMKQTKNSENQRQ